MRKDVEKRIIKSSAVFQILLMISFTFVFAIFMSETTSAASLSDFTPVTDTSTKFDYVTMDGKGGGGIGYLGDIGDLKYNSETGEYLLGDEIYVPNTDSSTYTQLKVSDSYYRDEVIKTSSNSPATLPAGTPGPASKIPQDPSAPKVNVNPGMTNPYSDFKIGQEVSLPDGSKATYYGVDSNGNVNVVGKEGYQELTQAEFFKYNGAKQFKTPLGTVYGGWAHLAQGLTFAITVLGAVQLLGGLFGLDQGVTDALSYSAFGGIMAGKLVGSLGADGFGKGTNLIGGKYGDFLTSTKGQFAVGAAVAIIIFIATYKNTETKRVQFQCLPWEAPSGGSKCEECNGDLFRPCTEYRCRSLGQACELLNANTPEAKCAWVSRNDVNSPKITPWNGALYPENIGLKYEPDNQIRPPAIGSKITAAGKCLPAFTPLEFGFTTDEPAQCKINYNHTASFADMGELYVGDTNYYLYNHTQKMRLPGEGADLSSIQIRNDGTMGLYVRCKDKNGNENVDEYVFTFCVDQGPDVTPPVMEEFSIPSGSYVTHNKDNVPIDLYVNEPAQCKWSSQNKNYDDMENNMRCYTNPNQVNADLQYTCSGNVTGVKNLADNKYYFRCKDQPSKPDNERNVNTQSKELILKGSQPLTILSVLPNETITGSTEYVSVDLQIETGDGAEEGKSICYFSSTGAQNSFIQMFETDNFVHKQTLSLIDGSYKYYFKCIDYGGNLAENSTSFEVEVDRSAPRVTRAYKEDHLKIVTNEDALCSYSISSCDFNINEGLKMEYANPEDKMNIFAEWKSGQTYYIKCQDLYGNQPSPNSCSIVVSSVELSKA